MDNNEQTFSLPRKKVVVEGRHLKRFRKDDTGLCLALACSFLPGFFYLRTENVVMTTFVDKGTIWVFVVSLLLVSVVLGCSIAFSSRLRHLAYRPVSVVCAGILLALGVTIAAHTDLSGIAFWCVSGISGAFIAAAIIEILGVCLTLLSRHKPLFSLPFVGLAFFIASVVWYILMYLDSLLLESTVVAILGLAAAIRLACILHRVPHDESCVGTEFDGEHLSRRKQACFIFLICGLLFSFFTMGLTFFPEVAGVPTGSDIQMKPGPYACAVILSLIALAVFLPKNSSKPAHPDRALLACLSIAIAIALVSPFTDTVMGESDFLLLNFLPYMGIALLNIIGWTSVVRFAQASNVSPMTMVGACCAGSSVAMATGLLVFFFMGEDGQMVSLAILTSYLAGMLIFFIANQEGQPARDDAPSDGKDACRQLIEKYHLTSREQEVLSYLIQGRSSRHIAEQLVISPETVRTHAKRIYKKCGVHTKEELLDLIDEQV